MWVDHQLIQEHVENSCGSGHFPAVFHVYISDEVLVWSSVWSKVQMIVYGPADATATPSSLASLKSRLVWFKLSGAGLLRLSWKRGRLTSVCD